MTGSQRRLSWRGGGFASDFVGAAQARDGLRFRSFHAIGPV
jgi:hypothetical protein